MSEHLTPTQLRRATQQTQEWLNDLAARPPLGNADRAYSFLRAVLHAVRDRLTAEETAHLGSQLPMIVRGFYFEGWRPALAPNDFTTADAFHARIRESLDGPAADVDVERATAAVLEFLSERVDPGEMRHVTGQLPEDVRALFPAAVA